MILRHRSHQLARAVAAAQAGARAHQPAGDSPLRRADRYRRTVSSASQRGHGVEPLKEIVDACIWAGLHHRTADVQARNPGRKVAHYMAKCYFQPQLTITWGG
jgi:hypothetical protein